MIRNVVFDMGNVVIRFDPDYFMTREGILDEEDRRIIRQGMFQSAEWPMMDFGLLTEDETEPIFLDRIPARLHEQTVSLLRRWAYPGEEIPGMAELIARLKAAGYGIYLLSNASKAQHEYWPAQPVSRLFDGKVISCDLKTVKPERKIYRAFTEKFDLRPEECVFIDDTPINVAGAIACGWKGIVFYGDAAEAEKKLREMGLDF